VASFCGNEGVRERRMFGKFTTKGALFKERRENKKKEIGGKKKQPTTVRKEEVTIPGRAKHMGKGGKKGEPQRKLRKLPIKKTKWREKKNMNKPSLQGRSHTDEIPRCVFWVLGGGGWGSPIDNPKGATMSEENHDRKSDASKKTKEKRGKRG